MKRILISIAALALATFALSARPTGLSIQAAPEYEYWYASADGSREFMRDMIGGSVEVGYTIPFHPMHTLYVGGRFNTMFRAEGSADKTIAAAYIETSTRLAIPVKYQLNVRIKENTTFFFNIGPTLDFWTSWSGTSAAISKIPGQKNADSFLNVQNMFKLMPDTFNRVNVLVGGAIGFVINHVRVGFTYDHSTLSMLKGIDDGALRFGQARVTVGYEF